MSKFKVGDVVRTTDSCLSDIAGIPLLVIGTDNGEDDEFSALPLDGSALPARYLKGVYGVDGADCWDDSTFTLDVFLTEANKACSSKK